MYTTLCQKKDVELCVDALDVIFSTIVKDVKLFLVFSMLTFQLEMTTTDACYGCHFHIFTVQSTRA